MAVMVGMATIKNHGEYQWEVQIRRKGYPAQRKTFETKAAAQASVCMIESEMDRGVFGSRAEAERTGAGALRLKNYPTRSLTGMTKGGRCRMIGRECYSKLPAPLREPPASPAP